MMCSNSSSKHSTIMKHLHREKCSHLHSCACACIRFHRPVCSVTEWKKRPHTQCDNTENKLWLRKKMNAMWSQTYMKYIRCFMRSSRFRVFVNAIDCYAQCVNENGIMRWIFYAFHFHRFFYIHFPAVVFDKKTMYFVCLFVGCCFVCCFFLICFARCTRISLRFYSPLVNTHSLSIVCDSEYALHSCRDCNLTIAILVRLLPHIPSHSHSHSRLSVLHSHSRHSFHFLILFRWPISITVFDDI